MSIDTSKWRNGMEEYPDAKCIAAVAGLCSLFFKKDDEQWQQLNAIVTALLLSEVRRALGME